MENNEKQGKLALPEPKAGTKTQKNFMKTDKQDPIYFFKQKYTVTNLEFLKRYDIWVSNIQVIGENLKSIFNKERLMQKKRADQISDWPGFSVFGQNNEKKCHDS